MAAVVVRLVRASSAAHECLERLHGVLWSSLDVWKGVLKLVGEKAVFGCTKSRLRWERMSAAL